MNAENSVISKTITLLDLSEEALEKIFSYTENRDLLNLTRTCVRFNKIIGTSYSLMNNFQVMWSEKTVKSRNFQALDKSQRKYRNIKLINMTSLSFCPILKDFLGRHSSTITRLIIGNYGIRLDVEQLLLPILSNIKELRIADYNHNGVVIRKIISMQFSKLQTLSIETELLDDDANQSLYHFIKNHNNLRNLSLEIHTRFPSEAVIQLMTIQLVKLVFTLPSDNEIVEWSDTDYSNFFRFLQWQRKSLKFLEFTGAQLTSERLNMLLCLELKSLSLFECYFENSDLKSIKDKNTSIKYLSVSGPGISWYDDPYIDPRTFYKFLKKCLSLKDLILIDFHVPIEVNLILQHHLQLEHLSITDGFLYPTNIPSLKSLYICLLNDDNEGERMNNIIKLIKRNPQITKLEIPSFFENNEKFCRMISEKFHRDKLYLKFMPFEES